MKAVMYHYVRMENKEYPFFKFLHIDDFVKQLDLFQKENNILHPDALMQCINNGSTREGYLLTFDDGLKDHFKYVFPELKKRGLSAIFYIPTGFYNDNKILSVHRLHLLLGKHGGKEIYHYLKSIITEEMLDLQYMQEFGELVYANQDNDEYYLLVKKIMNYFISYHHRDSILDLMMLKYFDAEKELGQDFYLSPLEIKEMSDAGMLIGSHTQTHPVMSKVDTAQQASEITGSFGWIESLLGKLSCKTFCYPYGGFHSFTSNTVENLEKEEVLFSFNVEARDIDEDDIVKCRQFLPRYDCNQFKHGKIYSATN